jgi:hypothetical protein
MYFRNFGNRTELLRRLHSNGIPRGSGNVVAKKKTLRRTIEEEAMEMGKTWGEVKRLANNRTRWRSFIDALCSSGSNRN